MSDAWKVRMLGFVGAQISYDIAENVSVRDGIL